MMTMIKEEDLVKGSYYFGAGKDISLALWDTDKFLSIDGKGLSLKTVPHFNSDEINGFAPRCEVSSLYVFFKNVSKIFNDCQLPGWDGKDAVPISMQTYTKLMTIISTIMSQVHLPFIGAEINGSLTLEWYRKPNKVTINIGNDDNDIYSCEILINNLKETGVLSMDTGLPDKILESIRKL